MNLFVTFKIAWKNIWRHPRRSIISMLAIIFSAVFMIFMQSLQLGSYEVMIQNAVKIHTGHIQIQNQKYFEKSRIRDVIKNPDQILEKIKGVDWIETYSTRVMAFALASSDERSFGAFVMGVDPTREKDLTYVSKTIYEGEYLDSIDSNQVLVPDLLANNLKVKIGDELVLLGQGYDGSVAANVLKVKGFFRTGQPELDRSLIFMGLETFQETFSMGTSVHSIVILGQNLSDLKDAAKKIENRIDSDVVVLKWQDLLPGLEQAIKIDFVSGWLFYTVLVIVVAFSILNTFLMAFLERTHEFGMLLSLGMRKIQIAFMLVMESFLMSSFALILGLFVAALLTTYFQIHGIEIPGASDLFAQWGMPPVLRPRLSWASLLMGPTFIFLITIVSGVVPMWRLIRFRPVEAMRSF